MTEHTEQFEQPMESFEQMKRSLEAAFDWLLGTDEMDDEERGVEIGNIYSYALNEGLTEQQIDEAYQRALEEE